MITSEAFGKTADGREVRAYVLRDGANSATVLNYGGIVQKLLVQGRENKTYNVVLGYGSPSEYDANGVVQLKRYIPCGVVMDERICSGSYFARVFRRLQQYLNDPSLLELPPEMVVEDR